MVIRRVNSKNSEPETPQTHEVRAIPRPNPLTDTQAYIHDPQYPFTVFRVWPDLLESHVKGQDQFRVVRSGLYYQIYLPNFPVTEFICWLRDAYDERRDVFLSAQGNKVF